MEYKTFVATFLLGLIATSHGQPPLPASEDLQESPNDRQILSLLLGIITPTITNLLTTGTINFFSAIYNAIASTLAGRRVEMIPLEMLLATPIRESSDPANPSSTVQGVEPSKRRPYTRAMFLDDKPLDSDAKAAS